MYDRENIQQHSRLLIEKDHLDHFGFMVRMLSLKGIYSPNIIIAFGYFVAIKILEEIQTKLCRRLEEEKNGQKKDKN